MSNEDCVASFENRAFRGIAIADGVSACTQSRVGAQIAVETVVRSFRDCGTILWKAGNRKIRDAVFNEVLYALQKRAKQDGIPVEEYSSTLAFAILNKKKNEIFLFSLGDSTILMYAEKNYRVAAAPPLYFGDGVCTTTTDGGHETAYVERRMSEGGNVFLFTDGGWTVAEKVLTGTDDPDEDSVCDELRRTMMEEECWDDSSFISAVL